MLENNKFNQAKQAALSTIGTIQQEAQQTGKVPEVGIMVFSGDCTADPTTIVQPFTTDLTEVTSSIQRIPFPHGSTPLPQAVERAKVALEKRLAKTGLPCGNLIVLGDGQSSCGNIRPPDNYIGPPKVKRVCGQKKGTTGANIALFTIGFGIEAGSTAERDLQYLAATSGGKYFNAQDQYQLTRSFQKINRVYVPIAKAQTVSANMGALGWFDAAYDFAISAQAYDTAWLLYKKFIEKYPVDSSGLYNYALMCEANEQYKSAADYYERYLQHAPNDPNRPLLLERVNTLRRDYDIFVAYTKRVVQNDLAYLERHYRQLMDTPNAVPLAGEFAGFIQEKQPFYRSLPEVLEMDTSWLRQYAKEIAASLGEAAYFLKQPNWDVNGIAMVGNAYLPLTRLVERLKQ